MNEIISNIKCCPKCGEYCTKTIRKCPKCGHSFGNDISSVMDDAKLERADRLALGKTLPFAQKTFRNIQKLRIRITRGYRGTPLDYDNLVGGCKPLRDEIARTLGIDDAEHGGIIWEYCQQKGQINKVEIFAQKED